MTFIEKVCISIIVLVVLCSLIAAPFIFGGIKAVYNRTVGTEVESSKRDMFEASRSYNQGKIQELAKMKGEYDLAVGDDKKAIASIIKHKFADFDDKKMPAGLYQFLISVRGY